MGPEYYVYTVVETELGWVAIAGRDGKLSAVELPSPTREEALNVLRAGIRGELVEYDDGMEPIALQIREYFAGRRVEFVFDPDLVGLTEFQQRVLKVTMAVPYGAVVSYRRIAERVGDQRACRAVGRALGRNPIPVAIPCHRIIASGGKLGGFSAGQGWKRTLLQLEGVRL